MLDSQSLIRLPCSDGMGIRWCCVHLYHSRWRAWTRAFASRFSQRAAWTCRFEFGTSRTWAASWCDCSCCSGPFASGVISGLLLWWFLFLKYYGLLVSFECFLLIFVCLCTDKTLAGRPTSSSPWSFQSLNQHQLCWLVQMCTCIQLNSYIVNRHGLLPCG